MAVENKPVTIEKRLIAISSGRPLAFGLSCAAVLAWKESWGRG